MLAYSISPETLSVDENFELFIRYHTNIGTMHFAYAFNMAEFKSGTIHVSVINGFSKTYNAC